MSKTKIKNPYYRKRMSILSFLLYTEQLWANVFQTLFFMWKKNYIASLCLFLLQELNMTTLGKTQ